MCQRVLNKRCLFKVPDRFIYNALPCIICSDVYVPSLCLTTMQSFRFRLDYIVVLQFQCTFSCQHLFILHLKFVCLLLFFAILPRLVSVMYIVFSCTRMICYTARRL